MNRVSRSFYFKSTSTTNESPYPLEVNNYHPYKYTSLVQFYSSPMSVFNEGESRRPYRNINNYYTLYYTLTLDTLSFFYKKLGLWPKPQTFLWRQSFEAHFFLKYFLILVCRLRGSNFLKYFLDLCAMCPNYLKLLYSLYDHNYFH